MIYKSLDFPLTHRDLSLISLENIVIHTHFVLSASKPEESSKESSSLPPILPSQEASASALQDPLNVSLAAPQSLTVNSATSVSGTDLDGAKVPTENSGNGMGSVSELPEMFQ